MQTKKQQQSQQTSKKIAIRLCQKILLLSILAFSTTGLTLEAQTQQSVFYDTATRAKDYFPISQDARNFMSLNLESVISVNVTGETKFFKAGTTVSPNILWAGMHGNNGRVGIGTNAPAAKLDVNGTVRAKKFVDTEGNEIDAASLSKGNIDSWNAAVVTANMITRITSEFKNNNDVTSTYESTVIDDLVIGKVGEHGSWVGIANNKLKDDGTRGDSYALIQSNTGTTNINAAKDQPIYFKIDNKAKMVLHGDKFGIGPDFEIDKGVIPEERLHVEGNVTVNGTVKANSLEVVGTVSANKFVGDLSRHPNKSIQFKRGNSMTDMVITGNEGLVGIGTSDPKAKLHVNGELRLENHSIIPSTNGFMHDIKFILDNDSKTIPNLVMKKNGPILTNGFGVEVPKAMVHIKAPQLVRDIFSAEGSESKNLFWVKEVDSGNGVLEGRVGILTDNPQATLHVNGSSKLANATFDQDSMAQMGLYAGLELPLLEIRKENFIANGERLRLGSGDLSVSGAADAKDLAYGVSVVHAPLASNAADAGAMQVALFTDKGTLDDAHYLDFVDAGTQEIVGSILGQELSLSSGAVKGVKLESAGADYAEYMLKVSAKEKIGPGSVVGVFNGKVSLKTKGSDRVMVVSTMPLVVGNKRPEMTAGSSVAVAFVGQVPVRVVGVVRSGDYVIASGKHDGTAVAVSPENLKISDVKYLIGRAWETQRLSLKKREKVVTVGISPFDFPSTLLEQLEERVQKKDQDIKLMKKEFKKINERLTELERIKQKRG